ncbi:hypothetical protein C6503_19380 [Candidatus Poribacteria bacterium]|nr:MAG: hypothetical protein C6503_19380 [Candidatus Poribacteria bacterium]
MKKKGNPPLPTVLELATQIKENTDREPRYLYCKCCDNGQLKIQVYPYELSPLGYHGTVSAYVCLTCGDF